MDGATGTALDWALALLRAPAERYRLRQRPLPPGVDELLAVAANVAPEASETTAVQRRESIETLREAARFYAREVLFHPEADAYRMLGVSADASVEEIKANHRLLQAWLHPDRAQSGDDSVFAARINTAWNQLRSSERRAAYDAERAAARPTACVEPEAAGLAATPSGLWQPPPTAPAMGRRRHRLLVFGLLGACLLLGGLVLRESERAPEPWTLPVASTGVTDRPVPASEPLETAPVAAHAPRRPAAGNADAAGLSALPSGPAAAQARPAPEAEPWLVAASGTPARLEPAPSAALAMESPSARPPAVGGRDADARSRRDKPMPGLSAATPEVATTASPGGHSPVSHDPDATPTPQDPPTRSGVGDAGTPAPPSEAASASGHDSLFGRLRQAFGRRDRARATPDLGVEGDVAFARIQQARQAGQLLLRYLTSENRTPPPIWDNPGTLDRADGLRRDLRRLGSPRLGAAQWRIGKTTAALSSDYSAGGGVRGTLTAAIVWREDRWLVTSVALETGP